MATIQKLSATLFLNIYSDPKFRNDIAFAHLRGEANGLPSHFEASSYPDKYIVTEEQIRKAKQEREEANLSTREKYKNDLLFKGMGSDFSPRWEDDITNYRIRTYFKNRNGRLFFIEILSSNDKRLIIDSAQDLDAEKEFKAKQEAVHLEMRSYHRGDNEYSNLQRKLNELWSEEPTHNYGGVRKLEDKYVCTKSDILRLVNDVFECDFKRMIIDEYNIILNGDDFLCSSPDKDYEIKEEVEPIFSDILEEQLFINQHRSKYPLPFKELTKYSSFDQILGLQPEDYTPKQRFERWNKVMSLDEEIKEIFADTLACDNCIHLDKSNSWCNDYGLPCSYNPVLKMLGMACGGACKSTTISKPIQLQIF